MTSREFIEQGEREKLLEQLLEVSVADETEVVWFERRHGLVDHGLDARRGEGGEPDPTGSGPPDRGDRGEAEPRSAPGAAGPLERAGCDPGGYADISPGRTQLEAPRLTVLLRVVERGRMGWHRSEGRERCDLENGLRQALALAKVQPEAEQLPILCKETDPIQAAVELYDPAIAALDLDGARERLAGWCGDRSRGRLHWSETRVSVWNSHGTRRSARATEASLTVAAREGAGFAAASSRLLDSLNPAEIVDRALRRASSGEMGTPPEPPATLVLAPEAVVELLNVINTFAFSGRSYMDGDSFLRKHRNVQVFDSAFHLRDDGLRLPGLPFTFDLEGTPKAPVDLIVKGQPSTPALTRSQGAYAGLAPTGQSVGGLDAFFGNLFLLPGGLSDDDLWQAGEGGLFVGWLDPPECFDPQRLEIRCRARGVRRIEKGALGSPLPDLIWESGLLGALARLRGIGRDPVARAMPSTPLGGISAPALVLEQAGGFRPA
ncbi:MAG: metallopeptidase TldD-related protein [Holophagales bacterium]|nr:metallopeptidase TldD-related protein [Holophagales bacterium]